MRALTVTQPWASLIIGGLKDVENRTWAWHMPTRAPGEVIPQRLAIHAGKQDDPAATDAWEALARHRGVTSWLHGMATLVATLPRGVLLGYVTVNGCHHARDCAVTAGEYDGTNALDVFFACTDWAEPWQTHDSDGDLYHWTLANPVELDKPIPMRGRQGLWNVPDDALAEVAA